MKLDFRFVVSPNPVKSLVCVLGNSFIHVFLASELLLRPPVCLFCSTFEFGRSLGALVWVESVKVSVGTR